MLRKIFVIKVEKWEAVKKLRNEDLHDLYFSPNIMILNNQQGGNGRNMWDLCGGGKT
jgi:hypothetical protein